MNAITTSIITIFLGGGLGALSRHFFSLGIQKILSVPSFWSILFINLLGCLCIGFLTGLFTRPPHYSIKLLLITGFLGAFTTYSTFMLDIVLLIQKNQFITALSYFSLHIIGGFLLCFIGLMIGRSLIQI